MSFLVFFLLKMFLLYHGTPLLRNFPCFFISEKADFKLLDLLPRPLHKLASINLLTLSLFCDPQLSIPKL